MSVFRTNIERDTLSNNLYRKIVYTDTRMQIVLMTLKPGEFIHLEKHNGSQFFRIESGRGILKYGRNKKSRVLLKDGISVVVPQNTFHFVKNTDPKEDLKLYTIYSPPQHSPKERNVRMPEE